MRLLYTPIKNYVHTVEAVIAYAGVADRIKPVPTRPFDPENGLAEINPLITVPALELEDGAPLYGGPVIYEYLDGLHGRDRLFPQDGEAITTRRQLWLADGLFDCTVRLIIEGWVPQEQQRPDVLERYWAKIGGTLDALTQDAAAWRFLWLWPKLPDEIPIQLDLFGRPTRWDRRASCGVSAPGCCFRRSSAWAASRPSRVNASR